MTLKLEWKLSNIPTADIGHTISKTVTYLANDQYPDLADLFPLKNNWETKGYIDETWLIVIITERYHSGMPSTFDFKAEELQSIKNKILPFKIRPHSELAKILGDDYFSFKRFTYVGPYKTSHACLPDLQKHIIEWLNYFVFPEVIKRNSKRIIRAIPESQKFNVENNLIISSFNKNIPVEILESLDLFRKDYPLSHKIAFIIMPFGNTKKHEEISKTIKNCLAIHKITALRADDIEYHIDIYPNILTYIYACSFGIAVIDRIENDDFNPNVALEIGFMLALRKKVCILKDKNLKTLQTDLLGKLYKTFDQNEVQNTVTSAITKWMQDKKII